MIVYKLKQISLIPDEYGKHIVIKMITAINENGKYIKHMKIDENMLNTLKDGFLLPKIPERDSINEEKG